MRKPLKYVNQALISDDGQAMVEYILMLAVAISFVALIGSSFRKSLVRLWGYYIQQISAACPGCPPHPDYRFRR